MSESPLTEGLAGLSQFFVGLGTRRDSLDRIAQLTVRAVGPADLVGVTMTVEGQPRTAVFTNPLSPELDQAHSPGQWPAFRRAAQDHGIKSTLSLPLLVDDREIAQRLVDQVAAGEYDDPARQ